MRVIKSDSFTPLSRSDPGSREPLLVHSHRSIQNKQLVVFVHGLGGERYSTWGDLPRFLFEDSAHYDVGLYDYASGMRRIRRGESVPLDVHASELADDLRDGIYDRIVFIGHSMGGLLCKAVIKRLINSRAGANGPSAIDRVAGLFLIATPQAGSLRVPRFLAQVNKDAKVLRAHSKFIKEINRTFSDTVCSSNNRLEATDKFVIPTHAVLATGDVWVDEFSSALNLPSDQIKHIRGSHGSIVRPESREGGVYSWIRYKIDDCFTASAPAAHPHWSVIRSAADANAAIQSPISDLDTAFRNSLTELVSNYLPAGGLRIDMNISINLNIVPQEGSS